MSILSQNPVIFVMNNIISATCSIISYPFQKTNFWYGVKNKITSEKGYTLGARTSSRIPSDAKVIIITVT